MLWREYGLAGTKEGCTIRETICNLVRYHSVPMYLWKQDRPEQQLIKIAANGKLAEDFSLELLFLLAEADMRGRIAPDKEKQLVDLNLCRELAREWKCLHAPYPFASAYAEHAYLNSRIVWAEADMYDDTWGEVILLSGLPGTGKDTWIKQHYPHLPMVSLDYLRMQLQVSPTGNQGVVIQAAKEMAREYLRKKQSFVWNATNTSAMIRGKQIKLFEDYHARGRIIFLETGFSEEIERNRNRHCEVPQAVINHLLDELVLPERYEAQEVEWYCV